MISQEDEIRARIKAIHRRVWLKSIAYFICFIFFFFTMVYYANMQSPPTGIWPAFWVFAVLILPFSMVKDGSEIKNLEYKLNLLKELPQGLKLETPEARELQYTVDTSGLDADEWHFGVGRKKKKKREDADEDEEYFDDSDNFTEIIDEE